MSEEASQEIQINIKGPSELKLQITITTDKTVLDLKKAIAEKSDVGADRQRLIYSGRVLKDEDALSVYKIQSQHTVHMVKGATRSTQSASSTPQELPAMQAGQNPSDPLTQLNSHRAFGAMAGFNPFQDMGVNVNDPNLMQTMMNSPQFYQQMSSLLSNPELMEQIIASNPNMSAMAPQIRALMQSEHFRETVNNPQRLQQMMQMVQAMGGMSGNNPFGLPAGGFPAPGQPGTGAQAPPAPGAGGVTPPFNPFWAFGPGPVLPGTEQQQNQQPNAFLNPALLQQMLAGSGYGAGFDGGVPSAPADSRPVEERFQVQLQQLQDMGFTNASQNVRALLATGGNVHSAIEYILNGGGA